MDEQQQIRRIWYTRGPGPSPLGLAAQLGWFIDEFQRDGIGVYTLQDTPHQVLRASHYDHRLVHSFRQGGSGPAIWAHACGRDTRVIGLNRVQEFQAIITLPERRLHSLEQLRGRRFALPRQSMLFDLGRAAALRGILSALDYVGLGEHDVELVDVDEDIPVDLLDASAERVPTLQQTGAVRSLLNGEVDAIFVRGAQGVRTLFDIKGRLLLDLASHPDPLLRSNNGNPRPITVDMDLLKNRPDIVVRFLSRVVAVGNWSSIHPAETIRYLARETRTSERHVRVGYGHELHNQQFTSLDEASIVGLKSYKDKDFLLARGFLPRDIDLNEWVDPRPLEHLLASARVMYS
ncbi:MAG: nitrate ABC transporter substrate-binding protein [Gammaproteobacteria bacterium HGW-Gammaproteobacteria-11]|nr:MAG: nitrate ABC transporter substrate-binding protein [Gammaproteobacteria bacterium HGW-Gammaproteobacteria-11]